MRITSNNTADLLAAINTTRQQQQQAIEQLSTGKRVNRPSDDPSASALLAQDVARTSQEDAFLRNITSLTSQLQTIDSSLSSVVSELSKAISLGVEGSTGTMNASDQQAEANQVRLIQQGILGLANLTYQGNYVFAGTATQTAAYSADPAPSSGVKYNGNDQVNYVTIAENRTVAVNMPGDQLFSSPGYDVFQSLNDLATALDAGQTDAIQSATTALRSAFDHVNSQRVFYGETLSVLSSDQTFVNQEQLQWAQHENNLVGADMSTTITNLLNSQTAYQATLSAVSKVVQTSLLDYLK
jgi:flagellar hook-associated protein 3 FlgL